ncbi:hypothetical protein Clacol_004208 [Clathrus columnatus]|uniref:Glycoside hydrolase 131 catalytic N-terminal domain-containing protein n=1 Tax=Clathrus columnatus TaxID=1419009 RepID=A0AAV5A9Y4_9AGAM|nr:hypothetical protein Clacol_004208 [Clathrus columnatus]
MTSSTNPPNPGFEHQIAFFESHFTEIKFGLIDGEAGTTDTHLRWDINSVSQWSTTLEAGNWYNLHIGVLRLPNGGTNAAPEDWYWSGIFIEEAPITTSIAGPNPGSGGTSSPPSSSAPTSSVPHSSVPPSSSTPIPSSTPPPTTTAPAGPTQSQWGQCGGTGWT